MPASLRLATASSYPFARPCRRLPLLSRCASKHATKPASRAQAPPARPSEDSEYPVSIKRLLRNLNKYINAGNDAQAVRHFHSSLTKRKFDGPTRFAAYDVAISLLLRRGHSLSAAMIYSAMLNDGYIPTVSVRAQMRVISMANRSPSSTQLLDTMRIDFLHVSYNERCLRDLIHLLMDSLNCKPEFIDTVVRTFLDTRPPDYTLSEETINLLVKIHARARSAKTARDWMAKQTPTAAEDDEKASSVHTTLLRDLTTADPEASATYRWILENMEAENVVPDLAFYNALIVAEVMRHRYDLAFAIYNLLMEHRTQRLTPDAHTYVRLFRALRHVHKLRSVHTRRDRSPRDVPTPRALYRDMLTCHHLRTHGRAAAPSPVLSTNAVHSALRAFLATHDYPAAFLALRTLRTCVLPTTLRTYRTVIAGLLARAVHELPRLPRAADPKHIWTYRFLGLATFPPGQSVDADAALLALILRLGTQRRHTLVYVPTPAPGAVAPRMPTAQQLVGAEPAAPDEEWDGAPLERIMRRAILAERVHSGLAPAKEVSLEIAEAKAELFDPAWFKPKPQRPAWRAR